MKHINHRALPGMWTACGLIVGACAPGASGAPGNRVLDAIAALPNPTIPGAYDIHVRWHVEAGDTTAVENFSTRIDVVVNGQLIGVLKQSLGVDFGGLSCGTTGDCTVGKLCGYTLGSGIDAMYCVYDSLESTCGCSSGELSGTIPGVDLEPGDEVMAILAPLGDALPDPPEDNTKIEVMGAGALGWNRSLLGAEVVKDDAGTEVLRLKVAVTSVGYGDVSELDFDVVVQAGPTAIAKVGTVPIKVFPFDGCSLDCEPDGCPAPAYSSSAGHWESFCASNGFGLIPWYSQCHCMHIFILDFPFEDVDVLEPWDTGLTQWSDLFDQEYFFDPSVVIRPSLHTSGELITAHDAATMTNGIVLAGGPSCDGDLTGDGLVSSLDLNALLAKFGLACP